MRYSARERLVDSVQGSKRQDRQISAYRAGRAWRSYPSHRPAATMTRKSFYVDATAATPTQGTAVYLYGHRCMGATLIIQINLLRVKYNA